MVSIDRWNSVEGNFRNVLLSGNHWCWSQVKWRWVSYYSHVLILLENYGKPIRIIRGFRYWISIISWSIRENWLDENKSINHLPVPFFTYIIPTVGLSFIICVIVSIVRFEMNICMVLKHTIRESLRYLKFIGNWDKLKVLYNYGLIIWILN